MRDDHQAGLQRQDELLEPLQPGEVQVVGRLVQQEDIKARQQHRGERGPRGLPAGQAHGVGVQQRGRQAEVGADLLGPLLEVGAAEVQPRLQRCGVRVVGAGLAGGQGLQGGLHHPLGVGDPGAAGQELRQPLAGLAVRLLRQQPDGGRAGGEGDGALVGDQLAGQAGQQGGLADPVGADHPDPRPGGDGERHPGQDQRGAADDGQAGGDKGGRHERPRYRPGASGLGR